MVRLPARAAGQSGTTAVDCDFATATHGVKINMPLLIYGVEPQLRRQLCPRDSSVSCYWGVAGATLRQLLLCWVFLGAGGGVGG